MSAQDFVDAVSYRPAWQQRAACRGMMHDPKAPDFFPPRGGNVDLAKAVCASCPVQRECSDYADMFPWTTLTGIWGGGTGSTRRARAVA